MKTEYLSIAIQTQDGTPSAEVRGHEGFNREELQAAARAMQDAADAVMPTQAPKEGE